MNGYISLQTASISALLPAVIKVQGYKQNNTQLSSGQKDKANIHNFDVVISHSRII